LIVALSDLNVSPIDDSTRIKMIISLIPNFGQTFHVKRFIGLCNANFEFMEILNHWKLEGGVDTLLNISPPPQNLNAVRIEDLGGHTVDPPLLIHLPSKLVFRN